MLRNLGAFASGLLVSATIINLLLAYVFHDVDADVVAHPAQAFSGLMMETVVFAVVACLIFGAASKVCLGIAKRPAVAREAICVALGIGLIVGQYVMSFTTRRLAQNEAAFEAGGLLSLVAGPIACACILAWTTRTRAIA